jgi:hypothetical protein
MYALVGVFLFGLTVNYAPNQAGYVATTLFVMAGVLGFFAPIVHNLCREKFLSEQNDSNKNPI